MRSSKGPDNLHVPCVKADNPALIEKHEEIERENALHLASLVATKHVKHNLTGNKLEGIARGRPNHQSSVEMEETERS